MALPRLFACAAALAVTAALVPAGAATASPLDTSVTGSASGTLPGDRFPFWANHPVRLSIDAHAGHGQATGTWQAVHTELDGSLHAAFGGTIDSLDAAGSLAILNGVITWKDNPANPTLPMVGTRVALSVDDRPDGDRVGFTWQFAGEPVADGQAHVPFFHLDQSTLTVRPPVPGPRGGPAGSAAGLPERQVTGTVEGVRLPGLVRYTVTVDAHAAAGAPPNAATGSVSLTERATDGRVVRDFRATVTELDVAGPLAIVTGTASSGDTVTPVGTRVSFSLYDGGGLDWTGWVPRFTDLEQPVLPYQSSLPSWPVLRGDLRVLS